MCGRFTITLTKEDFLNYLMRYEDIEVNIDDILLPNYNVAPSEEVIAMISHNQSYRVGAITWGFVPHFADHHSKLKPMINARSETLLEKYAFKSSVESKRCVIFADSFYEWKNHDGKKIPYRIMLKNKEVFAFAGIWTINKKSENPIYSAAIITTKANQLMKSIHERMPVILTQDDIKTWLQPNFDKEKHLNLLKPYHANDMLAYEVSSYVNLAIHKEKTCILPKENT